MEIIGGGIYKQGYYTDNFFLLEKIYRLECNRLNDIGVIVIDYNIVIPENYSNTLFYLYLYFRSSEYKELVESELFENI